MRLDKVGIDDVQYIHPSTPGNEECRIVTGQDESTGADSRANNGNLCGVERSQQKSCSTSTANEQAVNFNSHGRSLPDEYR